MFGRKKKEKKVEKVFETEDSENKVEEQQKSDADIDEEFLTGHSIEASEEAEDTENDRLNTVKEKISKILQSSNIEIIDENEGDEYDVKSEGAEKSQQDYDSLKAIFGSGEKKTNVEKTK